MVGKYGTSERAWLVLCETFHLDRVSWSGGGVWYGRVLYGIALYIVLFGEIWFGIE